MDFDLLPFVDLAHKFFGNEMMFLVLVNSRLANCDSLMEFGSKFHVRQYPLGFPTHAQNVELLVRPYVSECYFWSFRGVSCVANNFRSHLL